MININITHKIRFLKVKNKNIYNSFSALASTPKRAGRLCEEVTSVVTWQG